MRRYSTVLQYTDGTGWVYKDVTITGLTLGSIVKIGIGRGDAWSTDWQLTAEWAAPSITTSISYVKERQDLETPNFHFFL